MKEIKGPPQTEHEKVFSSEITARKEHSVNSEKKIITTWKASKKALKVFTELRTGKKRKPNSSLKYRYHLSKNRESV